MKLRTENPSVINKRNKRTIQWKLEKHARWIKKRLYSTIQEIFVSRTVLVERVNTSFQRIEIVYDSQRSGIESRLLNIHKTRASIHLITMAGNQAVCIRDHRSRPLEIGLFYEKDDLTCHEQSVTSNSNRYLTSHRRRSRKRTTSK